MYQANDFWLGGKFKQSRKLRTWWTFSNSNYFKSYEYVNSLVYYLGNSTVLSNSTVVDWYQVPGTWYPGTRYGTRERKSSQLESNHELRKYILYQKKEKNYQISNRNNFFQNWMIIDTVKFSRAALNVDLETLTVSIIIQFWKKLFRFEISV